MVERTVSDTVGAHGWRDMVGLIMGLTVGLTLAARTLDDMRLLASSSSSIWLVLFVGLTEVRDSLALAASAFALAAYLPARTCTGKDALVG